MTLKKIVQIGGIIMISLSFSYSTPPPQQPQKNETVVLLHGLARSKKSMNKMAIYLKACGYRVINIGYPSTSAPIEQLEKDLFKKLNPQIKNETTVHFVTHSMGGIILRHYLAHHSITNLGQVVMLAPPSQGSEIPDKLGRIFLFKWINGPAGNQLGTGSDSIPNQLPPPNFPLGIIAGDRSVNLILSLLIPGPDDGKVSLARVKPKTYTDYIQIHATHPFISKNKTAIQQTIYFLNHGHFKKEQNILNK